MAPAGPLASPLALLAALVSIVAQVLDFPVHPQAAVPSWEMLDFQHCYRLRLSASGEAQSCLGPSKRSKARSDDSSRIPIASCRLFCQLLFLSDLTSTYHGVLLDRRRDAIRLSTRLWLYPCLWSYLSRVLPGLTACRYILSVS